MSLFHLSISIHIFFTKTYLSQFCNSLSLSFILSTSLYLSLQLYLSIFILLFYFFSYLLSPSSKMHLIKTGFETILEISFFCVLALYYIISLKSILYLFKQLKFIILIRMSIFPMTSKTLVA